MEQKQPSPLSYDYVFNYIFKKLGDTFAKYRDILPPIEEVEQAIVANENPKDPFEITLIIVEMLKEHAEKSSLVQEIFENTKLDFYHGLNPEVYPKHEGKYYIDSVVD